MARRIRVSDEVYRELEKLRSPGETFNDVIKKLLDERRMGSYIPKASPTPLDEYRTYASIATLRKILEKKSEDREVG